MSNVIETERLCGSLAHSNWHKLPEAVREAALEWHVRLTSGEADDASYTAFGAWLAEEEAHVAAIEAVEQFTARAEVWRRADHSAIDRLAQLPLGRRSGRFFAGRRQMAAAAVIFLTILGGAVTVAPGLMPARHQTIIASADGPLTRTLRDGTTISLAPGAEMETAFSRGERRVTKMNGVAFFHVAADKKRPFTIAFGDKTITVVGTRFEVVNRDGARSVSVAQGIVTVGESRAAGEPGKVRLAAGKRLKITPAAPQGAIDEVPASSIGAWRKGFLEFDDQSLTEIVVRLDEIYGAGVFAVADNATGAVRFSGVLQLSDPAGVARRMGEIMPVNVAPNDSGYELSLASAQQD